MGLSLILRHALKGCMVQNYEFIIIDFFDSCFEFFQIAVKEVERFCHWQTSVLRIHFQGKLKLQKYLKYNYQVPDIPLKEFPNSAQESVCKVLYQKYLMRITISIQTFV